MRRFVENSSSLASPRHERTQIYIDKEDLPTKEIIPRAQIIHWSLLNNCKCRRGLDPAHDEKTDPNVVEAGSMMVAWLHVSDSLAPMRRRLLLGSQGGNSFMVRRIGMFPRRGLDSSFGVKMGT